MTSKIERLRLPWRDFHELSSTSRHGPIKICVQEVDDDDEHLGGCGYAWGWWAECEDPHLDDHVVTLACGGEDSMSDAKNEAEKWISKFVHYIKNPSKFSPSDPASDI